MSEALNLIHDTLAVFSGKQSPATEAKPGIVDLMDTIRNREKAGCRKDCHYPAWAGGCPYLFVDWKTCSYYGPNRGEEEEEDE